MGVRLGLIDMNLVRVEALQIFRHADHSSNGNFRNQDAHFTGVYCHGDVEVKSAIVISILGKSAPALPTFRTL